MIGHDDIIQTFNILVDIAEFFVASFNHSTRIVENYGIVGDSAEAVDAPLSDDGDEIVAWHRIVETFQPREFAIG